MEDVLGGRTDPALFEVFLEDWEAVLARRVDHAVEAVSEVEGVRGLVLAGSVGRDEPWPLSDIDLLPIYEDGAVEAAQREIAGRRLGILEGWIREGWWTGLDIGNLIFSRSEVERALALPDSASLALLADDRWYHSVDKGYRGRAVLDPNGLASGLAAWFTEHRFSPSVVQLRLEREWREIESTVTGLRLSLEQGDALEATKALRLAVKWVQIWLLERWGDRDNSLGRVGTRFERIASANGFREQVEVLNYLTDLDEAPVHRRMAKAPDWVWERHDRSWRARQRIGEEVTRLQDMRDVLRVCSYYEMKVVQPPLPEWVGVPDVGNLEAQARDLDMLLVELQRCL